jgi:hypothetical protein
MLELLNQLDGFDTRGDVKVIMATNRIDSLDPALIRPGRIDRKIEFPLPDIKTKRHIFKLHTSRMSLAEDVDLEEYVAAKDDLSGADIKAVCTEAGLLALRERRMRVNKADFSAAREKVRLCFWNIHIFSDCGIGLVSQERGNSRRTLPVDASRHLISLFDCIDYVHWCDTIISLGVQARAW